MTREEAKQKIIRNNAEWVWYETIDKIFDEFGEKLQDKDDEIELLKCRIEEAMKTKTCEWCKHSKVTISSVICGKNGTYKEADDYCKYFMPKDNA